MLSWIRTGLVRLRGVMQAEMVDDPLVQHGTTEGFIK